MSQRFSHARLGTSTFQIFIHITHARTHEQHRRRRRSRREVQIGTSRHFSSLRTTKFLRQVLGLFFLAWQQSLFCEKSLSRQTAPFTSSFRPCTELRDQVTLHGPRTMFCALPQRVATYQVDLPVLKFSSWKVIVLQVPSLNRPFWCNWTGESLFRKEARRINWTPPFFS